MQWDVRIPEMSEEASSSMAILGVGCAYDQSRLETKEQVATGGAWR